MTQSDDCAYTVQYMHSLGAHTLSIYCTVYAQSMCTYTVHILYVHIYCAYTVCAHTQCIYCTVYAQSRCTYTVHILYSICTVYVHIYCAYTVCAHILIQYMCTYTVHILYSICAHIHILYLCKGLAKPGLCAP